MFLCDRSKEGERKNEMAGQGREGKMALEELEVGESSSFTMRLGDGDSMVATNSSGGGISRMETGDGDRGVYS